MDFLKFDAVKCTLCGKCIDKCPFGALRIEGKGIAWATPAVCAVCACADARLAEALGGQLAFTRPMVENGFGDQMDSIPNFVETSNKV